MAERSAGSQQNLGSFTMGALDRGGFLKRAFVAEAGRAAGDNLDCDILADSPVDTARGIRWLSCRARQSHASPKWVITSSVRKPWVLKAR